MSEKESAEEDVDRATVTTDSYEQVLDQLDGDVAEDEDDELEWAEKFNCRCNILDGGPCCRQFTPEEIVFSRLNMREMRECMLIRLMF